MDTKKLDIEIERWSDMIPDMIWWGAGAISGVLAGHIVGKTVFKISVFHYTAFAIIAAICLIASFFAVKKTSPQLGGVCLWLGTFSIGLLTLR